jgi:hypothetical protein
MLQQSKREQESATMNRAEETMGINTTKRKVEEGVGREEKCVR